MKYSQIVITGIHTEIGKTVTAALLTKKFNAFYWKPVQSGLIGGVGDKETLQKDFGISEEKLLPEAYRLQFPASPHFSAARENVNIEMKKLLRVPEKKPLIIEGAGGLMVPLNNQYLFIDLFEKWKLPLVLVVNTYLGAINHSLLSIEAIRRRKIPFLGIITSGKIVPSTLKAILHFGNVPLLAKVPEIKDFKSFDVSEWDIDFEMGN